MKIKCRTCECLNFDYLTNQYDNSGDFFCGLHGCARVDPDGDQIDLDHKGGCGYIPKQQQVNIQLSFDFDDF